MKPSYLFVVLLGNAAFSSVSFAEEHVPPPADAVQSAIDRLIKTASQSNWPAEREARTELVALGRVVVPKLIETAQGHGEARVRRACYELLTGSFAEDERTADLLIEHGLLDQDSGIRYQAAFLLGSLKVQRAEQALQTAFEGAWGKDDRFTLAKSLAQLGKAEVLPVLIDAVSDDAYMSRYIGNIGLKALSGKNLEDFEGYAYAEGDYVIAGQEISLPVDSLTRVERKSGRFQAAKAYLTWLKTARPEVYYYSSVNYNRTKLRRAAARRFKSG